MEFATALADLIRDHGYNVHPMLSHQMHEGIDDSDDTPVVVVGPRPTGPTIHVFCPSTDRIFLYSGYRPLGSWDLNDPRSLDQLLRMIQGFYTETLAA